MKNQLALLIGLVVACVLIVQMFSFQVRYDQVAVQATFEEATAEDVIATPGIRFKYPWPIQKVYLYSTQLQILDIAPQQLFTRDSKAIIVRLYMTWRISNALEFYRNYNTVSKAEEKLSTRLKPMAGVPSQFDFNQFVNIDPAQIKLDEIEQQCADLLRSGLVGQGVGITIEHVGIRQILLSETTTPKVFEAMRTKRQHLAEKARAQGQAEALTIRDRATSVSERIIAFAERRAQAIRDEGNRETEPYFASFREEEEFAIFLRQIEALKETLKHNTTFILDANQLWFLKPLAGQRTGGGE